MVSRTMSGKDVLNSCLADLPAKIRQFLIRHFIEVQTANIGTDIVPAQRFPHVGKDVGHTGVRAAVKDDKPLLRLYDQALFMCKVIREELPAAHRIQFVALRDWRIICLSMRDQPDPVCDLVYAVNILNTIGKFCQDAATYTIIPHLAVFYTIAIITGSLPYKERSFSIACKERIQTVRMVIVCMRKHTCFNVGQVKAQTFRILGKEMAGAGIQQDLPVIG